jgi:hypothetical protein
MKACEVPSTPMSPQERAELETLAGRRFLSDTQALEFRKRLTAAGIDPARAYVNERRGKKRKKVA